MTFNMNKVINPVKPANPQPSNNGVPKVVGPNVKGKREEY